MRVGGMGEENQNGDQRHRDEEEYARRRRTRWAGAHPQGKKDETSDHH